MEKEKEKEKEIDDTLDHYVTGHVRNTVYGPAELLPNRLKRFRVMNNQEYITYRNKVHESGGFDVGGITGSVSGGIYPVHPTSCEWEPAKIAAEFAALKHAEDGGINVEYKQLVKVNIRPVGGTMYYLTFVAVDPADQMEKNYRAKVCHKPTEVQLVSFEAVPDSNTRAKEMQQEITAILAKIPEKGCGSSSACGATNLGSFMGLGDGEPHMVHIRPRPGELAAKGFIFFLTQIRIQNPNWKYKKARRAASVKWRSFSFQLPIVEFLPKTKPRYEIVPSSGPARQAVQEGVATARQQTCPKGV